MIEQESGQLHRNDITMNNTISISDFNVWINDHHILNDINLSLPAKEITCIVGPSGSGKSTLIRSINRINDDVSGLIIKGNIQIGNLHVYNKETDAVNLRSRVGMVFQKPCVFPKTILENVLFGLQHKKLSKFEKLQIAEENLKAVSLWKEVSHRLNDKAAFLSVGQQQRLCIARALALKPEIILLDEPTSALDPVSTRAIEDMMLKLKEQYTLIFVSHNIQQAKRIADNLVFLCEGKVIEHDKASTVFSNPTNHQTKEYLKDEFCDC